MSRQEFYTRWAIGIAAVAIWGWGNKIGVVPTLQTYAAYTLPFLVGHAIGSLREPKNAPPPPPAVIPPDVPQVVAPTVPAVQPDQPAA